MNKGFTLIELLAVIILLGILGLIGTATINDTLRKNKTEACNIQKKNIENAASAWASNNVFELPNENGSTINITLGELKGKYIDSDIRNPKTDELLSDDMRITVTRVDNDYNYEVDMEC